MIASAHSLISAGDDRAIRRAGEAARIDGNTVTLLRDGPAVFGAWLRDIAAAQRFILFENYIFRSDQIGEQLAAALIDRAKAGVQVYMLYDWFGCLTTSRAMWRRMARAGIKVRRFRPLYFSNPLQALQRDHRKLVCVDGNIGHVGGLCVGDAWAGDPKHGVPPWRDTAVRIEGPAAAALCACFAETWSEAGAPLPLRLHEPPQPPPMPASPEPAAADGVLREDTPCAGAPVRVVAGSPGRSRIYRLTQVLLSRAASRIWITDAYFLTPPTMFEALLSAARDGVDVRVLVPGRSDLPWISWLGRSGFAGLLQGGVRVFEWQGPMLHAKTTIVDGTWSRVGSSNLNLASLLTNWELDVLIEDEGFAAVMEKMFLADLQNSRELMLRPHRTRNRVQPAAAKPQLPAGSSGDGGAGAASSPSLSDISEDGRRKRRTARGTAREAMARAGSAVLSGALRRQFEPSAWTVSLVLALLLLLVGFLGLRWSQILGAVVAGMSLWLGLGALLHALARYNNSRRHSRGSRRGRKRRASTESAHEVEGAKKPEPGRLAAPPRTAEHGAAMDS